MVNSICFFLVENMKAMAIGCLKATFIILFAIMIYFWELIFYIKLFKIYFNLNLNFQTTPPPRISIEVL